MKKPKKLKLDKLPKLPKRPVKSTEQKVSDALATVPRITNETVTEHREEVLKSARKYIYPLQHSKHRIVKISLYLFVLVVVLFFSVTGLELYRFQTTGGFFYDVTSVVPFPVAKAGKSWVSYNSYLFELRHNMHYYETQQQATFKGKEGKAQLQHLKQDAMNQVIQDAYVKQLASENNVSVSSAAVNSEIGTLNSENRLGSSQQSLDSTLSSYFGWNVSDLKRKVKQELLSQAVVAKLDTATNARAQAALKQLQQGTNFATLVGQVSDDASTKGNGGEYSFLVTSNSAQVAPAITAELSKLQAGQVSGIINTGFTLDIIKVIDTSPAGDHVAHIQFTFQPITTYTSLLETAHKPHFYIKV
jgi:PPIC-type PPIASE domain/SurA N-terminal domain